MFTPYSLSRALLVFALFAFNLMPCAASLAGKDLIHIYLTQINAKKFEVTYTLDREVGSLYLQTTPDQSRAEFWKPKSSVFELTQLSGNDVIRRTDGKLFQAVSFFVDIVDISLPNYYRPFSPLYTSENGLVVHTGQYFVCENDCANRPTAWSVEVAAAKKNIVHYQGASVSKASWIDMNDGRSFYVGDVSSIESENLVAIIDPGLPARLKSLLDTELPWLIDRLAEEFGELTRSKPLVLATYNKGDPERSGFQGGVLNSTVSMHWWGLNLENRINENDELWFAAHEIAHFYQSQASAVDIDEVAWIHEGFAELMAADLLAQTNENLMTYVQNRYRQASADCATGLAQTSIGRATQLKKFDLHYKCGLLLHRYIGQNATQKLTVFELWNRYRAAINLGMKPSKQTYLDVVKKVLPEEKFSVLQAVVGSEIATNEVIKQFFVGSAY